ncbi:hypothetical protein [Nostoc sp.]|uniref:hypothetical protein n=1 Tax=Nostoc sp. TaxID=1180 RepID=UPI002FF52959
MNVDNIATMILEMTKSVENLEDNNNQDIAREKIQKRVGIILDQGCTGCEPNDPQCCRQKLLKIIKILKLVNDYISKHSNNSTVLTDIDKTMELIEKIYKDEENY